MAAPTAGALAQARRRVGAAPLRWLFDLLRGPAAAPAGRGVWWRGLLVCAIDGTILTVPDSPGEPGPFHQAGRQPRRHRLPAGPAAGAGGLRHPHPDRRGVRPHHQRGDHLRPGPAAQPPGRDDHAGRPELRGRPAGRQDRRHPGAVPDPGAHRRRRPQAPRPGPLRRRLIPLTLRRRASAGHRRPDHHHHHGGPAHRRLPADHHLVRPSPLPGRRPGVPLSPAVGDRDTPPLVPVKWCSSLIAVFLVRWRAGSSGRGRRSLPGGLCARGAAAFPRRLR